MVDTLLELAESLKVEDRAITEDKWQYVESTVIKTYVPQIKIGIERPCEVSDFETFLPDIERGLQNLVVVFKAITDKFDSAGKIITKFRAVNLLLLCGEHVNSEDCWTTSKTLQCCEELTKNLCKLWQCNSVPELLTGAKYEGLFHASLLALRPKLLKETWKTYPAAISCYKWILFHVKSPRLGPHLNNVLPTALIVMDDFVLDNRVIGIQCIQHIAENVTRTELGWHGHGEVMYEALEPILCQREEKLIQPVISCLITVLGKVEGGYVQDDTDHEWDRYDDVLEKVLPVMDSEDKLVLRLAYMRSLPDLLEASALRCCRWSNQLVRLFTRYLEVAGYTHREEAQDTLKAVHVFLCNCWPVVPHHSQALLNMLLKLLYDVTHGPSSNMDGRIIQQIEECLTLLVKIAPTPAKFLCQDIKTRVKFNEAFMSVVERVLSDA